MFYFAFMIYNSTMDYTFSLINKSGNLHKKKYTINNKAIGDMINEQIEHRGHYSLSRLLL